MCFFKVEMSTTICLLIGFHCTTCIDGGLSIRPIGRAFIPEVTVEDDEERSADQEPAASETPPLNPYSDTETTLL